MRKNSLVGNFGEYFAGMIFESKGYACDLIDAEGIDLAAYLRGAKDAKAYGVSVKTRAPFDSANNSLLLRYNDIVFTDEQARLRGLEPIYMVIWYACDRVDVLAFTLDYFLRLHSIADIGTYKSLYPDPKTSGAAKSLSTSPKSRDRWLELYESGEEGILYAARFDIHDTPFR